MGRRLGLIIAGGAALVAAMACAGNAPDPDIVAIAANRDAQALPRVAFYAGVPGRDRFPLPSGSFDLIVMDSAGSLAAVSSVTGGDDVAAALTSLELGPPPEDVGRRNREAVRDLFIFFARFSGAQPELQELVTAGHTEPAPTSPDDFTATKILGEQRGDGRLQGIRDWEEGLAPWGRMLELGLRNVGVALPAGFQSRVSGTPFAAAETLVTGWRDGVARDRRTFLSVVERMSGTHRTELYEQIAAVFGDVASGNSAGFYRRVELGDLDQQMWTIANFAYENDRPADDEVSYSQIARSAGLEPGRPYLDRWLQQSPSAWGFVWSVSRETAERVRLPVDVMEAARRQPAATSLRVERDTDGPRTVAR